MTVDSLSPRARLLNREPVRAAARWVLYWAQINRRLDSNHALAFAIELANRLRLPLLVYEGLTCSHGFANDRFHRFVLEGVGDNARRARELGLGYVFYLRRRQQDPNDVLYRLAGDAAALVTDDYPGYLAQDYNRAVPAKAGIPFYVVDSSCIVPMAELPKQEYAAYTIRPKIPRLLEQYLQPVEAPSIERRWRPPRSWNWPPYWSTTVGDDNIGELIAASEIDHSVAPSARFRGGRPAALERLEHFLEHNLRRYARHSREPSKDATSRLSPYLHFGHISSLEVALAVRDHAARHKLVATEFLEQLIVRRELAFNFASHGPDPRTLGALPDWARKTLAAHDSDPRPYLYSRERFERATTHDELWNATQTELLRDGVIHGYYRMYWGKKILEWSRSHQEALSTMIYLHDRYALDGRDPNTYANILWCFGLHDRPWKERPVFGMIRYMSLEGMRRRTDVASYIRHQQANPGPA